jgi:hypothetical protein
MADGGLAEREGFEPPIRLPVCRISSAVLSTTQPPLRGRKGANILSVGGYVSNARRLNKHGLLPGAKGVIKPVA